MKALVEADKKLTIFEYALQRLLLRHLVTYFVKQPVAAGEIHVIRAAGCAHKGCALGAGFRRWPIDARSGRGCVPCGSERA